MRFFEKCMLQHIDVVLKPVSASSDFTNTALLVSMANFVVPSYLLSSVIPLQQFLCPTVLLTFLRVNDDNSNFRSNSSSSGFGSLAVASTAVVVAVVVELVGVLHQLSLSNLSVHTWTDKATRELQCNGVIQCNGINKAVSG